MASCSATPTPCSTAGGGAGTRTVRGGGRKRLLVAEPPEGLVEVHRLLSDLLSNAMAADEALAEQVKAYQCGQFHESVAHSDRLQAVVVESQRMDRDLIVALRGLPAELRDIVGILAAE